MATHPSTALTIDLLSASDDTVRQMVFIKMPEREGTYRVLSRQLTTTATARHWKAWPVNESALAADSDSWLSSYTRMHAERGFRMAAEFVVEVTQAEIDELRADTTPRALMIRIDRSRESVDAGVFKPMHRYEGASAADMTSTVNALVQAWTKTTDPEIAPAGRARAPKAAPEPTATATTPTEPVAAGSVVKPGDKIIIAATGSTYVARKMVDKLSDVQALHNARTANLSVLMTSLPGTGKTMAALAAFGDDLLTVQCTADTESADFTGTYVPTAVAGEFRWVDGPLVRAMEEGRPLLVDEIALADTRALAVLYSAMDGRREIVVTANPARGTVRAKEGFFVIAACNPDVPGARMSEALLSRFPIQAEYTTDWDAMEAIGVPKTVVTAARNLDAKRLSGEISTSPQARELVGFMRTAAVFGEAMALSNMVQGAPESDRAVVADVLSRSYGKTVKALTTQ